MTRLEAGTLQLRLEVAPVADVGEGAAALADLGDRLVAGSRRPAAGGGRRVADGAGAGQPAGERRPLRPRGRAGRRDAPPPGATGGGVGGRPRPGGGAGRAHRVFQMLNRISGGGRAGLGLTIAKAFVEAHGGRLWVEDRPGGGARFRFSMPRADLAGERGLTMPGSWWSTTTRLSCGPCASAWRRGATRSPWPHRHRGGHPGLAGRPDVVVLDLGLPDLDGIEVCRASAVVPGADHRAVGRRRRGAQGRRPRRRAPTTT